MQLHHICEHIEDVASPVLLGCFAERQYWKSGKDHLGLLFAPAAMVLIGAISELQKATLTASLLRDKKQFEQSWVANMEQGTWFSEAINSAESALNQICREVKGTVHLTLNQGYVECLGISLSEVSTSKGVSKAIAH